MLHVFLCHKIKPLLHLFPNSSFKSSLMKTCKNYLTLLTLSSSLLALSFSVSAQNVGINSSGNKPSSSAILDLRTGNTGVNEGFLPQEVALSATNTASPVTSPDTGLIVYNYATAGTAPNNVAPGYYYWTGAAWVMMLAPSAGTSGQVLTSNGGGSPSWTTLSTSSGWSLTGNAGTSVGTNFIGTTDTVPLEFKVDDSLSGYLDYDPNIANSSFGFQALNSNNNNGTNNDAFGYQALYSNTSGTFNVADGVSALYRNTTGNSNVADGGTALYSNTSGGANTAIGRSSLLANTNGNNNNAVGQSALRNNISGSGNIAVGYQALTSNTTGSNNMALGYLADVASGALTNATAIGANATVDSSNTITLGSNSVKLTEINGALMPYYSSAYNAGTSGQVLTSKGPDVAPQWATSAVTTYTAGTGIKISNDSIINTQSAGAVNYVGTSYLGITSGAGSTGTSEGTGSNLYNINIGASAGSSNTTGNNNIALGNQALNINDKSSNEIAIGNGALNNQIYYGFPGGDIAIGYNALGSTSLGLANNIAIGYESMGNASDPAQSTAVGYQSMYNAEQGDDDAAFGYQTLVNDDGGNNAAFGYQSLRNNTNGTYNLASGNQALYTNTNGNNNLANGSQALYSNTNGNDNTANGSQALYSNTNGNNNLANGFNAMFYNTTGSYNIAMGDSALGGAANTGNLNIAIGSQALYSNTSGIENIATGDHSLDRNTTGSYNIAMGDSALGGAASTANLNIAIGSQALYSNTSGSPNIASGYQALRTNTSGSNNIAIGYQALQSNNSLNNMVAIGTGALGNLDFQGIGTGGDVGIGYQALYLAGDGGSNTAIGYQSQKGAGENFYANVSVGYQSLSNVTGGNSNCAIGYQAGKTVEGGEDNTFLGYQADVSSSGLTNATAIGANASVSAANCLVLGSGANVGIGISSPTSILHTVASGAKTANYSGNLLTNTATSSTASITKTGLEVQSTGTWNGTSATNIGLYVSSVTGGTANYDAIFNGGGNVGIGTTSPSSPFEVVGTVQNMTQFQSSSTTGSWMLLDNTSTGGISWNLISSGSGNSEGAGNLLIRDNSAVRMIVQSATGNVGIGTSAPSNLLTVSEAVSGAKYVALVANTSTVTTAAADGLLIQAGQNTYTATAVSNYVAFETPAATIIGSVSQSSSTGVAYNTTSDERLKENIKPTAFGLTDLMKIQVKDYTYIGDKNATQQTGYLAQQLYTVFPNAVHVGGDDAKTNPWMVDYGRMTPLLVKSIQDQQQIIDEQNKKLDSYQQQMAAQQQQIDELKKVVDQLVKDKK
jgi:trimeric autotransporter adhesin